MGRCRYGMGCAGSLTYASNPFAAEGASKDRPPSSRKYSDVVTAPGAGHASKRFHSCAPASNTVASGNRPSPWSLSQYANQGASISRRKYSLVALPHGTTPSESPESVYHCLRHARKSGQQDEARGDRGCVGHRSPLMHMAGSRRHRGNCPCTARVVGNAAKAGRSSGKHNRSLRRVRSVSTERFARPGCRGVSSRPRRCSDRRSSSPRRGFHPTRGPRSRGAAPARVPGTTSRHRR